MNKSELIAQVSIRLDVSKRVATDAVETVFDVIQRALAEGDKVTIPGFGTFEKRLRAPRKARNPRTGATVKVPATSVPAFRAGNDLKNAVAGKRRRAKP